MELIGLYLAASYLLVVAGAAKAVRSDGTARALVVLGGGRLPISRVGALVRVAAVGELVLGLVAVALPRPPVAWLVAGSYASFAVVVAAVRRSGGPLAGCGCFGAPDTPATTLHVVVDAVLAVSAAAVAVDGVPGSMLEVLSRQPGHGVPLVAASVLVAWLAYLVVSAPAGLRAVGDRPAR